METPPSSKLFRRQRFVQHAGFQSSSRPEDEQEQDSTPVLPTSSRPRTHSDGQPPEHGVTIPLGAAAAKTPQPSPYQDNVSILVMCSWLACIGQAYTLPLATLKTFVSGPLHSSSFEYSLLVAVYSVGEMVGTALSALHSKRRGDEHSVQQQLVVMLMLAGLIGGILYAAAGVFSVAMAGRLLTGCWGGGMYGVMRTWLAKHFAGRASRMTTVFYSMAAVRNVGMAVGPCIGSAVAHASAVHLTKGIVFDEYRTPGWIVVCLVCVSWFLLLFFRDPEAPSPPAAAVATAHQATAFTPLVVNSSSTYAGNEDDAESKSNHSTPAARELPWVVFLVPFAGLCYNLGWAILETFATPLMQDQLGMPSTKVGYVFLGGTIFMLVTQAMLAAWAYATERQPDRRPRVSETALAVVGLLFLTAGFVVLADWQAATGNGGTCSRFSCSYDHNAACNLNVTESLCKAAQRQAQGEQCEWNKDMPLWGHCNKCAPVCHTKGHTLTVTQMSIGLALVSVGFATGTMANGAVWTSIAHAGFLQQLYVGITAIARVSGPIIAMAAYVAGGHHSYPLCASLATLFLLIAGLFALQRQRIIDIQ